MSNSIINWRFGSYHFQINRDYPWVWFGHNPHQANWKEEGRPFFEAY